MMAVSVMADHIWDHACMH